MSENVVRSGGCSCGAVRYETIGDPTRVLVCHCKQCQRRTGSAFKWIHSPEDAKIFQEQH